MNTLSISPVTVDLSLEDSMKTAIVADGFLQTHVQRKKLLIQDNHGGCYVVGGEVMAGLKQIFGGVTRPIRINEDNLSEQEMLIIAYARAEAEAEFNSQDPDSIRESIFFSSEESVDSSHYSMMVG